MVYRRARRALCWQAQRPVPPIPPLLIPPDHSPAASRWLPSRACLPWWPCCWQLAQVSTLTGSEDTECRCRRQCQWQQYGRGSAGAGARTKCRHQAATPLGLCSASQFCRSRQSALDRFNSAHLLHIYVFRRARGPALRNFRVHWTCALAQPSAPFREHARPQMHCWPTKRCLGVIKRNQKRYQGGFMTLQQVALAAPNTIGLGPSLPVLAVGQAMAAALALGTRVKTL